MAAISQALSDLKNGYTQTVNSLGTNMTLEHDDGSTETIKAHIIPSGKDDVAIINALGVDAIFMNCLATPVIKKFEKLTAPSGRGYIVDAVHERYVQNVLVGQRVIAR